MSYFLRFASENKNGDEALVETGLTMLGTSPTCACSHTIDSKR
jgi:hypothetical protein